MSILLKNRKQLFVVCLVILAIVVGSFVLLPRFGAAPLGMREVKSYNPNGVCLSVNDPACANCPGKVVDSKCFVPKGEFEQYP